MIASAGEKANEKKKKQFRRTRHSQLTRSIIVQAPSGHTAQGGGASARHERHERYVNKTLHLAWHALSALLAPAAAATPFLHLTSGAMPVLPSLQKNIGL